MHSIFTVQTPVPNQILFIRLINLRAWLRWHAGIDSELGISFPPHIQPPPPKTEQPPFQAARSILAVLQKLLEISSALAAEGGFGAHGDDNSMTIAAAMSPKLGVGKKSFSTSSTKQQSSGHNNNQQQHKPLPPLLSTPLRHAWVECTALCLSLGSNLPGNLRTDAHSLITKMMEISNWNPRSKMASGGVRLSALMVLGKICVLDDQDGFDLAKRVSPYAYEILTCCHKGLLSGGAGEPGHRVECVSTAWKLAVACRRSHDANRLMHGNNNADGGGNDQSLSFLATGAMEDRAVIEAIKFIKRATADKYPEVRIGAAVFAGMMAPMLIRNIRNTANMRGGRDGASGGGEGGAAASAPLVWLEDVTQVAMQNIDDESAGVATAWATCLARCLCASSEYGQGIRAAQSEDQASRRSADVDHEAVMTSNNNNNLDLASKFKALRGATATAATMASFSVPSAIAFLVTQFVKCGGEATSNKCGGTYSIGGRASRIGYADALTEYLRLQSSRGEFQLVEALNPVIEMVGASFEKQVQQGERASGGGRDDAADFYAPSSPRSSPEKRPPPSISTAFLSARASKTGSSADSSIGRLLASNVVRKGITENVSESIQLTILRDLATMCRSSVGHTTPDGGTDARRSLGDDKGKSMNRHQLQVALIEMSHIVVAVGEAGASSLEDLHPILQDCLSHPDHGVRHEAAAVYAAIAQAFPSEGRKFAIESLSGFSANLDAISSLSFKIASTPTPAPRKRFGRPRTNTNENSSIIPPADELLRHQATLHGNALAVSMLMHEFPHCHGGVATAIVSKTFEVAAKLLHCQFDEKLTSVNPTAACTCVRAGYCLLSGALTMGIDAIIPHVSTIFSCWQGSSMAVLPGVSKLSSSHDLMCVEAMLSSVVCFLKFCPTLLLAVPDALTRLTAILEKIFPLISSGGKFESEKNTAVGKSRLSSARASVMEAYSWLPPGSFPMSADRIFSFAVSQIQELTENDVLCSILDALVSKEDKLIDAHSFERAVSPGQIGGSVALDNNISLRSSDVVHHNEREAILHLLAWRKKLRTRMQGDDSCTSPILGAYLRDGNDKCSPTPLHEVGRWREPLDPIGTSKVRLLDCCIHVFAATFGLQDGQTQAEALQMLESMYNAAQPEKTTNRFNVSSSLIAESQGKLKSPEEDVPSTNLTAAVLACLQAHPLYEATHDTLIGVGPPWMVRATDLLLRLLPTPSDIIRRGAAEGLALLATLGVSEDANTLQSTILHSLDEVMTGSIPGNSKMQETEILSYARAGSLLTLACIQRAAMRMTRTENERAESRSVVSSPRSRARENNSPPVMIMMTRLLPSLATQNFDGDSLLSRAYALHSFGILISNSLSKGELSSSQLQIAWKAVEAVETSFLSAWSAVTSDISKGREREKFAAEPTILGVILRVMTTLLPWLESLQNLDKWIASRFASYASTILEHCSHPVVCFEGCVFFERLSEHRGLIEPSCCCVVNTDNAATVAMPFLLFALKTPIAKVIADEDVDFSGCHGPIDVQRSAVMCLKGVFTSEKNLNDLTFGAGKTVLEFLHDRCGRRRFEHFSEFRSLSLPRSVVNDFEDCQLIEAETIALVQMILAVQLGGEDLDENTTYRCLQWLLWSVSLISGDSLKPGQDEPEIEMSIAGLIERSSFIARSSASPIVKVSNPPRWQLKCVAANIASLTMASLLEMKENPSIFNYQSARARCTEMLQKEGNEVYGVSLHSFPVLHLEELVTTACIASAATSNNSELPSVQVSGLRFLITVLKAFGEELDASTNDGTSVLEQYSSQIISAVRHALNAESLLEESVATSGFHRLFAAGCDALFVMINGGFVSEPVVLRRLLQPLLLTSEDVPFTAFGGKDEKLLMKSNHVTDDSRSFPLFRLSKLCFAARVSMMIEVGDMNQSAVSVINGELEKEEVGRAVHSAAAAMDGFLLSKAHKKQSGGELPSTGLTFANLSDVDELIVDELVENWPVLATSSVVSIVKAINDAPEERSEQRESMELWLSKLLPIILIGLREALSEFKPGQSKSSASEAAALFICALRLLVGNNTSMELCSDELGNIISMVTDSVLFQLLGLSDSDSGGTHPLILPQSVFEDCTILMQQACGFIEDLCKNHSDTAVTDLALLSHSVMKPLVALQEKQIKLHTNYSIILSSCIRSSVILLRCQREGDRMQLEKALVQLSLSTLKDMSDHPSELSNELKEPCLSLLRSCSSDTSLQAGEWGEIATYSVSNELWDAWAIVCASLPPGIGIKSSINAMKGALGDLANTSRHAGAIVALRVALHSTGTEDPSLVCFVLHHVGFEVLQLLRAYSLRLAPAQSFDENRVNVCAEAVKVNMIAFQYLSTTPGEEGTSASFLLALFQVLVESVSFNGLPGNLLDTRSNGADENIGRMCAQVFVHVVRSNPLVFKSTISAMAAESRTILENAVRADMSGYAAPKREKKKLSLKGFR